MKFFNSKVILYLIISIPIIFVISIFVYLEVVSGNYSQGYIPVGYEKDINKEIYQKINIINEK